MSHILYIIFIYTFVNTSHYSLSHLVYALWIILQITDFLSVLKCEKVIIENLLDYFHICKHII